MGRQLAARPVPPVVVVVDVGVVLDVLDQLAARRLHDRNTQGGAERQQPLSTLSDRLGGEFARRRLDDRLPEFLDDVHGVGCHGRIERLDDRQFGESCSEVCIPRLWSCHGVGGCGWYANRAR